MVLTNQNVSVDCSTNLDTDVPELIVSDGTGRWPAVLVGEVKRNCQFERIWEVTDTNNRTKTISQFLILDVRPEIRLTVKEVTVDCEDDIFSQEILSTAIAQASCFKDYVPINLTIKEDTLNYSCPGKIKQIFCIIWFKKSTCILNSHFSFCSIEEGVVDHRFNLKSYCNI